MTANVSIESFLENLSLSPLLATKRDSQLFINREEEIRKIRLGIKSKMNVLILGERGSGKTSLVNHVQYTLRNEENIMSVNVSMSFGVKTPLDFLSLLTMNLARECMKLPSAKRAKWLKMIKSLLESISILKSVMSTMERERREESDAFGYSVLDRLEELLSNISRSNIRVCFFIDDSDKNPVLFYEIMSSLRDFLWKTGACFIAVGDTAALSSYRKPPVDAFFDLVIVLKPFSVVEINKLLKSRIGGNLLSNRACELIDEESGGNPRCVIQTMQSAANRTLETLPSRKGSTPIAGHAGSKESEVAVSELEKELLSLLLERRKLRTSTMINLTPVEKQVLEYLQLHGPSSASNKEFQSAIGVGRSRLVQIIAGLEKRGVLTSTSIRKLKLYSVSKGSLEGEYVGKGQEDNN